MTIPAMRGKYVLVVKALQNVIHPLEIENKIKGIKNLDKFQKINKFY